MFDEKYDVAVVGAGHAGCEAAHAAARMGLNTAMGEMLRLIRENNVKAADVEKVDMGGNSGMMGALLHHRLTNALQGRFSMEFCMAIPLLDRKAGLNEFTDPLVQRPDVQDLLKRVNFYVDPESERAGLNKMTSMLKIYLKGGKVLTGRADFAKAIRLIR